ncbi:hypothetical protein GQ600_26439 [Phytophthora cactorum]|nr:hypothetical protein GQ600_26439 [Phytophthora cactorum]
MEQYHPNDLESFIQNKEHGTDTQQATQLAEVGRDLVLSWTTLANDHKRAAEAREQASRQVGCLSFRPLVIVEDEGFIAFVCFITQDLGRRTQLRHEVVILAANLRRQIKEDILQGCTYFSITSDIWTVRNARSFISLTIHYVDEAFLPENLDT